MSKNSETGFAKNVANFQQVISFCKGYGADYHPARPSLTLTGLQELLDQSQAALANVKDAKAVFDNATNSRMAAFKELKPFCAQVVSAFISFGVSKLSIDDARGILRKVQGRRAKRIEQPEVKETETGEAAAEQQLDRHISVSQLSYYSLLDHFRKLVITVMQQPLYAPNEAALCATGLQEKLDSLEALNQAVIDANTKWSNARIKRDKILFDPVTGTTQIAADVKAYVSGIFGSTSQQFKQIKGISFKR